MEINFHGATQTVTGSKHLITTESGKRILLDCGMYQGMGMDTHNLNREWGFDPASVDAVILSHAHIDHSGLLPRLVKEGFRGHIYCTHPTRDLCDVMLEDSAFIQEADMKYVNKRKIRQGKTPIDLLYTIEDVKKCMPHFRGIAYDTETEIFPGVSFTLTDNGHILGSASVHLKLTETKGVIHLTFTGDIGRYDTSLLKDPSPFEQSDIIICESTYGDRLHNRIVHAEQDVLNAVINTCKEKKGKLIIPAFSLGRTQEIVYTLNKLDVYGLIPDIKIYIDSPLSNDATRIMRKHISCLNMQVQEFIETRPDPFGFDDVTYIQDVADSKALNAIKEPCIIISASGMAEAGRVKHHIKNNIGDPSNTILLVGYAEPLSLAGRLRAGDKRVKIFGEEHEVKADVSIIDSFSAHADYQEMLQYLSCQDIPKVHQLFLVHGHEEAMHHWKTRLKNAGFRRVHIPEHGQGYKFEADRLDVD